MAKLIVYPRFKAWDTDGTALASGKIYTYKTGTTTNKATYTDSTEGTPNANPVVLDSNGEADIWLLTDEEYKFVIKDSADTTLYTIDPIVPISSAFTTLERDFDVGTYSIISSGANDLTLEPAAGQNIILDGFTWPIADGTNGQVLQTDGSKVLSWVTNSADLSTDTTPQLGGDLDTNSFNIGIDTLHGINDENGNEQLYFTTTASATNYVNITNAATNNGPTIAAAGSDTNIDLTLSAQGSGKVYIDGYQLPSSDGTSGQVLQTDGSKVLSFIDQSKFVQVQQASTATVQTTTTQIPTDDTIPQNTEGDEILTLSITPSDATNRLIITGFVPVIAVASSTNVALALFQDSTANALQTCVRYVDSTKYGQLMIQYEMAAGTTSSTTFKLRMGPDSATTAYALANNAGTRVFGGAATIRLMIEEHET